MVVESYVRKDLETQVNLMTLRETGVNKKPPQEIELTREQLE